MSLIGNKIFLTYWRNVRNLVEEVFQLLADNTEIKADSTIFSADDTIM
jgi:hypothetical protein